MVEPSNESMRSELMKLAPSGDLMDLARDLRALGLESLLICRPDGRIRKVITDRQIAQLAMSPDGSAPGDAGPAPVLPRSRQSEDDLAARPSARSSEGEGIRSQTR